MNDTDEFNRLINLGLPTAVALEVWSGSRDEDTAVAHYKELSQAREWSKLESNRDMVLVPCWDCSPENFHLSLDGVQQHEIVSNNIVVIDAKVSEVTKYLHSSCTRLSSPWSEEYKGKTGNVAYRWSKNLPVTPTYITVEGGTIVIRGGHHRFHLAVFHSAIEMPFLVDHDKLGEIQTILPSAKCRNKV